MRDRLHGLGAFVQCLAQGGQHLHLLGKLPVGADPRDWMGLAKKHSSFQAKAPGWQGKLWGKRGKELRVRDRAHQLNVYRYILKHVDQAAWMWVWKRDASPRTAVRGLAGRGAGAGMIISAVVKNHRQHHRLAGVMNGDSLTRRVG